MKQEPTDHTISVRVSPELLSQIQARVAEVAKARAGGHDAEYAKKYPATISGLMRKALETYFEIGDDPRDYILANCPDVVTDEVRAVLASAVFDNKTRDILERLAKREPTEKDFG
jgi:hypothetical protein